MYLNEQILTLNGRVDSLQESVERDLYSDYDSKIKMLRENQAEVGAEIDKVKGEMQGLLGHIEESNHLVKLGIEKDTTEQDIMKTSLADLTQRIAKLETGVKRLHEYLGLRLSLGLREQRLTKGGSSEATGLEGQFRVEKKVVYSEKESYDLTLAMYRQGKYEEAIDRFESFLQEYPKSDLADNAQFWIGECYMSLKKYKQAILAYQEVIKTYSKGNKVPNAMLRQAMAFHRIKDRESSRIIFKKLIKKYPNSSEAKIAKAKLKMLSK